MARIAFSSTVEEILGSLAGTTFQDSYFGLQMRTRVTPRNPRSYYQQLRRGEFGFLSSSFRELSPADLETWLDEAGTMPAALRLFIACNINIVLIGLPPITIFTPGATPDLFEIAIDAFTPEALALTAAGFTTTVPADTSLLIAATALYPPQRTFVNQSAFSPILTIPEGTDLSTSYSILAEWIERYGITTGGKKISISSRCISNTNGLSSPTFEVTALDQTLTVNSIVDLSGAWLIDYDGTIITFP